MNSAGTVERVHVFEQAAPAVPAPIWRRVIASTIDGALIVAAVVPTVLVIIWIMEAIHGDLRMTVRHARYLSGILTVASWVIGDWIYNAKMLSSPRQATFGKKLMAVRVMGVHGERPSFGQASTRHFTKFLSTFLLFFGFIMAAFGRRKQALHDIVAATVVVNDDV